MSMISSYCRPSSRPPQLADLSHEPSKQGKVSFAEHPDHASPRSCTNTDFFLGVLEHSKAGANQEANATIHPANDSYEDVPEETPAEVAMLLASVADIASKEIKADPPIMSALADVFPRFPDLSSTLSDENEIAIEDMDYEAAELPPKESSVGGPTLMHFDHKKKMRAVSMDLPELRGFGFVQEPMSPPPSPPHEDEAIPTLLQWRNLRGQTTSPPHAHLQQGIFSTPPPSPLMSARRHGGMGFSRSLSAKTHNGNRPRSVSMAEGYRPRSVSMAEGGAIEQVPVLELAAPTGGVASEKPKKLILRKKFSWKNYPEVSFCYWSMFFMHYPVSQQHSCSYTHCTQLEEFLIGKHLILVHLII